MSQTRTQEFYLSRMIDEAHSVMDELKELRLELTEWRKAMPKKEAAMAGRCDAAQALAGETMEKLRLKIHEARSIAGHIEAHNAWKTAVLSLWGEQGLRDCVAWIQKSRDVA